MQNYLVNNLYRFDNWYYLESDCMLGFLRRLEKNVHIHQSHLTLYIFCIIKKKTTISYESNIKWVTLCVKIYNIKRRYPWYGLINLNTALSIQLPMFVGYVIFLSAIMNNKYDNPYSCFLYIERLFFVFLHKCWNLFLWRKIIDQRYQYWFWLLLSGLSYGFVNRSPHI